MTWLRRMRDGWQAEISAKAQKRFPSLPVTCRMPYLLGWRNLWSIWTLLRLTVGLFFAELLNWQTWRKHEENIEKWNEIFFPLRVLKTLSFQRLLRSYQAPSIHFLRSPWRPGYEHFVLGQKLLLSSIRLFCSLAVHVYFPIKNFGMFVVDALA